MINRVFYRTRKDGVSLYRIYSDTTPTLKQQPTGVIYNCWVYKLDEEGNETKEVDWEQSGVIDVENAPYSYVETNEVIEEYGENQNIQG